METTSSTSNVDVDLNLFSSKRRKLNVDNGMEISSRWKTAKEQQIYSSKLISALRHIRHRDGGHTVRKTADKILAASAKGETRWSRAILTSRLSRMLSQNNMLHKRVKGRNVKVMTVTGDRKLRKSGLKKKVSLLGNVVPGCRKVSFPKLLEETSDYIAALEMQVRAMSVITELLSGGVSSSTLS